MPLTEEYAVIGVDLPTPASIKKVESINSGVFPIISSDPKIDIFYNNARKKGNYFATTDSSAFKYADVIIVDINLDVQKINDGSNRLVEYNVTLEGFRKAMETIGNHCKEDVLIVVETTVPPGTCQKVVLPIITKCLVERGLSANKFKLGHSYERVMPGPDYIDSIQNFYRVYSGVNEESAIATEVFLKTIISTEKYPLTRLGNANATEMAKVLENSYRAMNIAFAQEWARFAEEAGVNIYEVVDAIRMRPTHANLMYPGIGVGGYCLTKDPLLASWAKTNLFGSLNGLDQSERGVQINDQMPLFAFDFLIQQGYQDFKNKNVALLGVSYRSNVGDTRYTPVEPFYNFLNNADASIILHDPFVRYWEELSIDVDEQLLEILDNNKLDSIIFTTSHSEYKNNTKLIEKILSQDSLVIFDTVGVLSQAEIDTLKTKHKVLVLGRGDI
ncbi:MAG: nucleotide sugar dehydrogenase [Saprospiraceae bacterium]|nr:nucleotide sugar dehydrogenase [Saprospiraceae bacterium]